MKANFRLPEDFSPEQRGDMAEQYFLKGYNCCQSVLLAFADILEDASIANKQTLIAAGSGFGGGMGRLREVCGSFSAAVMIAGFIMPAPNPGNMEERTANYALVQDLASAFKSENGGSVVCRELLSGVRPQSAAENPRPSDRTPEYYKKRPCPKIINASARIIAEKILAMCSLNE